MSLKFIESPFTNLIVMTNEAKNCQKSRCDFKSDFISFEMWTSHLRRCHIFWGGRGKKLAKFADTLSECLASNCRVMRFFP